MGISNALAKATVQKSRLEHRLHRGGGQNPGVRKKHTQKGEQAAGAAAAHKAHMCSRKGRVLCADNAQSRRLTRNEGVHKTIHPFTVPVLPFIHMHLDRNPRSAEETGSIGIPVSPAIERPHCHPHPRSIALQGRAIVTWGLR
eukprot:331310-Pelagomonas_calceolata.AAC.1